MRRTQHGELELVFEKRGDRTVLVHDFQRTPLQIVRPFELEPGVLTAIIINPTAGVMAGDLYRISVTLREGARVVLLTQSATKIHRMDAGLSARQEIIFNVASGARLEYFPGTNNSICRLEFHASLVGQPRDWRGICTARVLDGWANSAR
jgi:urease accessory protein